MSNPVKITDGTRFASIDKNTNALNVVDYEHHEIHAGSSYRVGAQTVALANGNTLSIDFKTPATGGKQLHMVLATSTENTSDIVFYEDVEISSNGSALTPRNANRNFGDGSTLQFVFKDSTIVTTNTVILVDRHVGAAGTNPSKASTGGGFASRHEWVLRENTWYSGVVTNVSGDTQLVWIGLDWYEHTPKKS